MRLPYLQLTQDAIARARTMARLLHVPEPQGIGLAVLLFAWALEMAPEDDLSGQMADPNPAEWVAAAVGWEGDPAHLYSALVRVGFIARAARPEDGFDRVKGLDRYAEALAGPAARSAAAKRAAEARWGKGPTDAPACDRNAPALPAHAERIDNASPTQCAADAPAMRNDAKTQTQTQTHLTTPPPPAPRTLAKPAAPAVPATHPPMAADDAARARAWWTRAQERRLVVFPSAMPEPPPADFMQWWPRALEAVKGDEARLDGTWDAYLASPKARELRPPASWRFFGGPAGGDGGAWRQHVPGQDAGAAPALAVAGARPAGPRPLNRNDYRPGKVERL